MRRLGMMMLVGLILSTATAALAETGTGSAKNVILMISDGLGFNGWEAAKLAGSSTPYDGYTGTNVVFYGMTHYMLNDDGTPQWYNEDKMWSDFGYSIKRYTDSAASATALYTGTKTDGGTISLNINDAVLTTFFELAANAGKSTGAVTSVEMSHATPAAVDAHDVSRGNYAEIANEMIYDSDLNVIMGAGPGGDNEKYVGGTSTWADITDADGANGFTYIHAPAEFQDLADGTMSPPSKVIGLADTTYTLGDEYWPNENDESKVPRLETMTKGALNVLSQNSNGFALMIEGGAVDWRNHNHDFDNMVIEQKDFDNSVAAVINWVETNSSWNETLLVITSDHECGMIWGQNTWTDTNGNGVYDDGADTFNDFERVTDSNGDGKIDAADVLYGWGSHSNQLVPLWAMGAGSDLFANLVDGNDATAATFWNGAFAESWNGDRVDNTDVFTVMHDAADLTNDTTPPAAPSGLSGTASGSY